MDCSAWGRSSASRICASACLAPAWTLFGNAFKTFVTLWTQHRWVRVSGKTSRSAFHSPSAPSPTITTGAPMRGPHAAAAQLPQQLRPRVARLPEAIGDRHQLLGPIGADPPDDQA